MGKSLWIRLANVNAAIARAVITNLTDQSPVKQKEDVRGARHGEGKAELEAFPFLNKLQCPKFV